MLFQQPVCDDDDEFEQQEQEQEARLRCGCWLVRGWPSICPMPLALRVLAGLTGIYIENR